MKSVLVAGCLVTMFAASPSAGANDEAATSAMVSRLTEAGGPSRLVLDAAFAAYQSAAQRGEVLRDNLLTVIDYTRPSTEPRPWVLDLDAGRVIYRELVAHGKASGDNTTRAFSNAPGSLMSSVGLFLTDVSYVGRNGYSLRLRGLEAGVNDRAYERAIVLHGATYVSEAVAARVGRLGRSWGCPAVRADVARPLIDLIKDRTVLYAYGGPGAEAQSRHSVH